MSTIASIRVKLMHFCENEGNNDPKEVALFLEDVNTELRKHEKMHAQAEHFISIFQNPDHKDYKETVLTHFEKLINAPTGEKQKKGRGNNKKKKERNKQNIENQLRKKHSSLSEKAEWLVQQYQKNALWILKYAAKRLQIILEEETNGNNNDQKESANREEMRSEDNIAAHQTLEFDNEDAEESIGLGGEEQLKEGVESIWLHKIEDARRTYDNLWSQVSTYNNRSHQQNDPNMPNVLEKKFIFAVAVILTKDIPGIVDCEGLPGELYVNVLAAITHYYERKGWDGLDKDFLFRVCKHMQLGTGETGGGRAMFADNRDKETAELLCNICGSEDSIDLGDEEEHTEAAELLCELSSGEDSIDLGDEEEQKECSFEQAKEMECDNPEQRALLCDKSLVNEKKNEGPEDENLLAFFQSIGPSLDINGNQVPLSTRRKTRLPVQPQLFQLENPNDPNLKCTTCDKVIGNNCALYYCRPCRRVRICDNKNCAILHHCKIRKPKHFCSCGKDAMFNCSRCGIKHHCSKTCQHVDWKCHKTECELPLID